MILLHLRDKDSHTGRIKDMFPSPSGSELLEQARDKIRKWRYSASRNVLERAERLHQDKKSGDDERDTSEYVAPSVMELAKVVKNRMSILKDFGDDGRFWSLTVEGTDALGNGILVFLRLPKDLNDILRIVDFELVQV